MTSQRNWTGPHSMACEVLPQGRCKPLFSDMWTLVGKQDFKWSPIQHSDQYSNGDIILDHQNKTHNDPSEVIAQSSAKALCIQVTTTFKPCVDCALDKAKQCTASKKAVPCSQVLGERFFFDISSPSTPTFGGKCHWLLVSTIAGVSF